jgi:hypothetical protein
VETTIKVTPLPDPLKCKNCSAPPTSVHQNEDGSRVTIDGLVMIHGMFFCLECADHIRRHNIAGIYSVHDGTWLHSNFPEYQRVLDVLVIHLGWDGIRINQTRWQDCVDIVKAWELRQWEKDKSTFKHAPSLSDRLHATYRLIKFVFWGGWVVTLELKIPDLWVGVYFTRTEAWICLIPCLRIHIKKEDK